MARTKARPRRSNGGSPFGIPAPPLAQTLPGAGGGSDLMSKLSGFLPFLGAVAPMAAMFSTSSYIVDSVKIFILGALVEGLRRVCMWIIGRFRFQLTVTAHFYEGDQAHDWIINLLTEENVWRRSCEFQVSAKSSARKWGLNQSRQFNTGGHADYVPTWSVPQIFKWKGYYIEVMKSANAAAMPNVNGTPPPGIGNGTMITLTVYTIRMSVLSDFIEEARVRYIEAHKPHVIVHVSEGSHGPNYGWGNTKQKPRRPVSSVVLPGGKMEQLLQDAKDFLNTENWYNDLGIPHRRGYLLYGPPGTGKTSTIYSLAGELGLEIYSLSLSTGSIDDIQLQHAVNGTPKRSILLIEDIDCAFPSREDEEEELEETNGNMFDPYNRNGRNPHQRSLVTMSGLLNVLDGVGSDEGKIFFATTNYVDRLDPALMRPGRIDRRVEYRLATKEQARTLFLRFFPPERFPEIRPPTLGGASDPEKRGPDVETAKFYLEELALAFAQDIPEDEFSTAELQGFLLGHKHDPIAARNEASAWVEEERAHRKAKEEREQKRKDKALREARLRREKLGMGGMGGMGMGGGNWGMSGPQASHGQWNARSPPAATMALAPASTDGDTKKETKESKPDAEAVPSSTNETKAPEPTETATAVSSAPPSPKSDSTASAVLVTPPSTDQ